MCVSIFCVCRFVHMTLVMHLVTVYEALSLNFMFFSLSFVCWFWLRNDFCQANPIELEKSITPLNGGFKGSNYDFWNQPKILHPKHWIQVDFEKLQILDFSSFLVFRVSKIVCCVQG